MTNVSSPAIVPSSRIRNSNMPIWVWNNIPVTTAAPAQRTLPIPFNSSNELNGKRMAPARGRATVDKPGTNFASTRVSRPQRSKRFSVVRTQESGDSDTRQRNFITRRP